MSRAWDEQEVLNLRHADNLIFHIQAFAHFFFTISIHLSPKLKMMELMMMNEVFLRVKTNINMIKIKSNKKGYNLIPHMLLKPFKYLMDLQNQMPIR